MLAEVAMLVENSSSCSSFPLKCFLKGQLRVCSWTSREFVLKCTLWKESYEFWQKCYEESRTGVAEGNVRRYLRASPTEIYFIRCQGALFTPDNLSLCLISPCINLGIPAVHCKGPVITALRSGENSIYSTN